MKLTDIQKTATGYVIRQSKGVHAITLVLCIFLLSLGVLLLLATPHDGITIGLVVLFMTFFDGLAVYLFCLDFGYRIVVDETGVHRYSFNRVKHTLLWRHIRSCGVGLIPVPWRYHQIDHLAFYASTEANPVSMENKVFIKLNPSDEQAIRESGLLSFCRAQMENADRTAL